MVQLSVGECMGLSSLVGFLLGCTALVRANSMKHPSGCLQPLPTFDVIRREHLIDM